MSKIHKFFTKNDIGMACEWISDCSYNCILYYKDTHVNFPLYSEEIPTLLNVMEVLAHDIKIADMCESELYYGKIVESLRDDPTLSSRTFDTIKGTAEAAYRLFGSRLANELKQLFH